MTIQMKATEQHFPVVLFVMLYKVVLTIASVDEILKCDHPNEIYWPVLSQGAIHFSATSHKNGIFIKFWPWPLLEVKSLTRLDVPKERSSLQTFSLLN